MAGAIVVGEVRVAGLPHEQLHHHHHHHPQDPVLSTAPAAAAPPAIAVRQPAITAESQALLQEIVARLAEAEAETPEVKPVVLQFYVNRVLEASELETVIKCDLYLKLNWRSQKWIGKTNDQFQAAIAASQGEEHDPQDPHDPHDPHAATAAAAHAPPSRPPPEWQPGVEVTNCIERSEEEDLSSEALWLESSEEGIVAESRRLLLDIYWPTNLRRYPYDEQVWSITFESFHWKASDMRIVRLHRHARASSDDPSSFQNVFAPNVLVPSFTIEECNVLEHSRYYRFEDRTYSQLLVQVRMRRQYWRFMLRYAAVLAVLTLMSMSSFSMAITEPKRWLVLVISFTTICAMQFVAQDDSPKVSYPTRLDYLLWLSYLFVSAEVLQTAIMGIIGLHNDRNIGLVLSLDRWCAIGFGTVYLLALLVWLMPPLYSTIRRTFFPKPVTKRKHE